MRHGHYTRPTERGSLAVYTNQHANTLGRLKGYKRISPRQWAAGLAFEATWVYVCGSASPGRDSTIPPIGGTSHETDEQADRMAKRRARLHTILNRIGPKAYNLLVSVCVFGESLGPVAKNEPLYDALRAALTECAEVYGIADGG